MVGNGFYYFVYFHTRSGISNRCHSHMVTFKEHKEQREAMGPQFPAPGAGSAASACGTFLRVLPGVYLCAFAMGFLPH